MKAFAKNPSSNDAPLKRRSITRLKQTSKAPDISALSTGNTLIHRKLICPCDGGCPRCQDSLPNQTTLTIGQSKDKYEQNADRVTGKAQDMTRKCFSISTVGKILARISRSPSGTNKIREQSADLGEVQTCSSATTTGNRIYFNFDPDTTSPRPQCNRIVFVQFIQMTADDSAILPGAYHSPLSCRDITALSNGWYLDQDCLHRTPYAQDYGPGFPGSSNGTTKVASHFDAPSAGRGGDRGFYSASNPTGWQTVVFNFETYAFCAEGIDCGTWYDGIQWNYTSVAGRPGGISTITGSLSGPGSTAIAAFNQYNSVKGFTPCLMSVMP